MRGIIREDEFFMPFLLSIILFLFSACHTEPLEKKKEPQPPVKPPVLLPALSNGEGAIKEIIFFPYDQHLQNGELRLVLHNPEPMDQELFENMLLDLGRRLVKEDPEFHQVLVTAEGKYKTHLTGILGMDDFVAFEKNLISRPELVRRLSLITEETVDSLKAQLKAARMDKDLDRSLDLAQSWVKQEPDSPMALALLANIFRDRQDFGEAIHFYEKLVSNPDWALFALHNLGICYLELGGWDRAIDSFQKALILDPQQERSMLPVAEMLRKKKKYTEALSWIQKARTFHETSEGWLLQGNLLRDQKKYTKAKEAYLKALALKKEDPLALYNLVLIGLDMGRIEEAKGFYERLQKINPELALEVSELEVWDL